MAVEWARADAGDPEPWYLMGVALTQMNRLPEAQRALECSLTIEPAATDAWARLAPVYRRQGQTERASQIESHLGNPDSLTRHAVPPATDAPCVIGAPSARTQ
jgi:uncharacterized protein HemY